MAKGKGKQSPNDPVELSKGDREDLLTYLAHANPNHMTHAGWSVGSGWSFTHGETRSASEATFHIGCRVDSQGNYYTCIAVAIRQGNRNVPVAGTTHNWGTERPSLAQILDYYQQKFNVQPLHVYDGPSQRDNNNNGGGGNGGGTSSGGGGGSGSTRQIFKDDYGGYYYVTEDEPYVACDAQGQSLKLLSVYIDASNKPYYYHKRQRTRGTLTKDPRTQKTYFRDKEGRSRSFYYVGKESGIGKRFASASRPTATPAPSYYPQPGPSRTSSKIVYHIDPTTGWKYFEGPDGQTQWAS